MTKTDILGSKISVWNLSETASQLHTLALINGVNGDVNGDGGRHYVCVSNVHTVVMGKWDKTYARITNEATLATADGVPLIWASKILNGPRIHGRASGPDIMVELFTNPKFSQLRHYFYGSTPEVLKKLEVKLRERYPSVKFVGFLSPPVRGLKKTDEALDDSEKQECSQIDDVHPHIVWVGLGAPKQEIWMHRVRKFMNSPVLVGVGAAFDFLSENKKRAPEWMRKTGLEWAYRFSQEPTRLASRYLKTNPVFVLEVAKQALLERLNK